MIKIMKECWDKGQEMLREHLKNINMNDVVYEDLVKLTFNVIYNYYAQWSYKRLDMDRITRINHGDYQGTLLFLIPFDTYQPSEYEYLMTYIGYGSCSGCDVLENIKSYNYDTETPTENQVTMLMRVCKDIICNTIKPYNSGWRENEDFEIVEDD